MKRMQQPNPLRDSAGIVLRETAIVLSTNTSEGEEEGKSRFRVKA